MLKLFKSAILFFMAAAIVSCGEQVSSTAESPELIIGIDGLIESLGGDCSAVQVRTRSLGSADLNQYRKVRIDLEGMSDADLSSIQIYYLVNNEAVYIVDLMNREQINNTRTAEITAPSASVELFSRVTLKSSVCTGQIFYLTFRDLKVFGIR